MQPSARRASLQLLVWAATLCGLVLLRSVSAVKAPTPSCIANTPQLQASVLMAGKMSLRDPNRALQSWSLAVDHCKWRGVLCNQQRLVYKLDLHALGLSGSLPGVWSAIQTLQAINLDNNNFKGPLPKEWGALRQLQYLNIAHSFDLQATLPPEWGAMSNLRWLHLGYNKLTGTLPKEWGSLSKLQYLGLVVNQLSGPLPREWAGMRGMQILELGWNYLSGPFPSKEWGAGMWKMGVNGYLYIAWNYQVSGCLPAAWKGVRLFDSNAGKYVNRITPGTLKWTQIKGFCQ